MKPSARAMTGGGAVEMKYKKKKIREHFALGLGVFTQGHRLVGRYSDRETGAAVEQHLNYLGIKVRSHKDIYTSPRVQHTYIYLYLYIKAV